MKRRFHAACAATAVTVLVATCGSQPSAEAATASTDTQNALERIPASSAYTTPVVADGVFSDAAGSPIANGSIVLLAWPAKMAAENAPEGTNYDLKVLTRSVSSS